ncbi:MAG TPA: PKD domain-containing protein [Anaerolineae bacterium]|nr:PKD domain-containing protein [Anaerolineae bacterium]
MKHIQSTRWPIHGLVLAALLLAFLGPVSPVRAATTYYSQGSLAPNLTTSWNSARDGTGSAPANFTAGDVFVIQDGHNMTTTAAWSVTGTGATIQIEDGGTLTADNIVAVPTFQIDNGGTYIHNAVSGASNGAGSDIPGSTTRTFGATSTVEIQKWANGGTSPTALPSGVSWGNLTINVTTLAGSWNQIGTLTTINGTLSIKSTGGTTREFRLAANASYTLNLAGDLLISGGIFNLGSGSTAGQTYILNLGGKLEITGGALTSTSTQNMGKIVFTGGSASVTFAQSAGTLTGTNINWQIANGKTVTFNSDFSVATSRSMTIDAGGAMIVSSGKTFATATTVTNNGTVTINGAFQLNGGGWVSNNNDLTYGPNSTLVFNAAYAVNNDPPRYWPSSNGPVSVTVKNTLTLNVARTVEGVFQTADGVINAGNLTLNGTAQINTGGYFDNAPTYGVNATLVYNPGGDYNANNEWRTGGSVGSGVPKNITIQNSTAVALPTGGGGRTVPGVLTIASGSLTLGGANGDDLYVGGNWINDGTFTPNGRAVHFNGDSTISGASISSFFDVFIEALGNLTAPGGDMAVAQHFTNNGAFNHGNGTIVFNGAGVQTITGDTTFNALTVNDGVSLTTAADVTVTGALVNNGWTVETKAVGGVEERNFGLAALSVDVTDQGSLSALQIVRRDTDHAAAPAALQTGKWWRITPTGSGFTADLTLPHAAVDSPQVCRYTGSWDCAADGSNTTTVWRNGVMAFSDWTVGSVPPVAVPVLDTPADNAVINTPAVTLTWNTSANATGYNVDFNGAVTDVGNVTQSLHASLTPGVYTWTVAAYDAFGNTSVYAAARSFRINAAPVANAGGDQAVEVGAAVTLDGSGSSDPDNHIPLIYGWQQTGGPAVILSSAAVQQPTFTAPATPAILTFTLTVTDTFGLADTTPDEVVITVNDAVVAGLAAENDSPTALGQATALTATVAGGSNVTYAWDFGDGVTGAGATASHSYPAPGNYTAVVTAANDAGSASANTVVEVYNLTAPTSQNAAAGEAVTFTVGGRLNVVVTPTNAAEVTVFVSENANCRTTGVWNAAVKHCYNIALNPAGAATVRFYFYGYELNGNDAATLDIYHYSGSGGVWDAITPLARNTTVEPYWVEATVSSFSPFTLAESDNEPTAVTFQRLLGAAGWLGWLGMGALPFALVLLRKRRA